MIDKLTKQINNINKSLNWLHLNQEEQYEQRFLQLVDERRKLKMIRTAASDNPAIAAFGKSQVGKSYLISCLLQDNGKPFLVKAGSETHNFVFAINPPSAEGGGTESTGVVSRFSSFKRDPEAYNCDLPVLVRTFTIADIIIILSDSYFNDIANYTSLSESEVMDLSRDIYENYINEPRISSPVLEADDILNIKQYFKKHINNAQTFISEKCTLFDRIALVIDRIPDKEYANIFANLWNKDPNFTRLFNRLYDILKRFNFANYVYLPIDAVLHKGIHENTIMSVQCLKELLNEQASHTTDAYTRENDQYVKRATAMPKSEICAVCAEVIFKIEDDFLNSTGQYDLSGVGDDVKQMLNQGKVEMSMLRDNDLLDFPGARSREEEKIEKLEANNVLLNIFLRGKVAYLFNKYNEEMSINILLYCHHNKDNDVTGLYKLLEEWVNNYVGRTPDERRRKLEMTKVSPLFFIGTMFNLDMTLGVGGEATEQAINKRWDLRFNTVVNNQCFHRNSVDWVKNWTRNGTEFKNCFVLRDYKFSGEKSGLYKGFKETGKETDMIMSESYYQMMRQTFINNEYSRQFFKNPALSWDVAASINNDGALYIIEQLAIVAARMSQARDAQFTEMFADCTTRIRNIMKEYYVTDNKDELLKENIRKSRRVNRELDFTCNKDNYYFGHMLQGLQMKESVCYNLVHQDLMGNAINEEVNDFSNYEIIHKQCAKYGHPLNSQKSNKENWESLMEVYLFDTQKEAADYLARQGVDYEKLFSANFTRKLRSFILADKIFDSWCNHIKSVAFMNEFSGDDSFDSIVMSNLVDNIIATAKSVKLADKMAKIIADIVDVVAIGTANENLISDMLVSTINDFVMDLGYSALTEEQITTARHIGEERNLHIFDYICRDIPARYSDEELTNLFNDMTTKSNILIPSFEENYNKWVEYMIISFIAHLEIPDYDHAANEALDVILKDIDSALNGETTESK